jgi:hypothetical protein
MKPPILLLLPLALTAACTGLYSRNPDGGNQILPNLGPPTCMRVLADAIEVRSPVGAEAFQDIAGLAFDQNRNLHVLNRVGGPGSTDKLSFVDVMAAPNYVFVRSYGLGKLGPVRDLALDREGNAYVVENFEVGEPAISRFDPGGTYVSTFLGDAMNQSEGFAIAIDGSGRLNVAGVSRIYRYEPDGTYVDEYGFGGVGVGKLLLPTGLAWDNTTQSIWVADLFQNFVEKYTPGNSTQQVQFGGRGTANGKFDGNEPTGKTFYGPNRVAVDAEGKIYASDPFASRLQKFAPNGGYLGQFDFATSNLFGAMAIHPDTGVLYVGRGATIDVICPF